jgi:amino acid adenylation domain-containing protein
MGQKVEAVAKSLIKNGCRKGHLIPVVTDGGRFETISALAVISAGGAYVHMEANNPKKRLDYLIDQCRAKIVLTHKRHQNLNWPGGLKILAIDEISQESCGDFDGQRRLVDSDDLAYVIHTSGSTGQPKGVMIRHFSALNTILAVNSLVDLSPNDRGLALSRFTFDLSVWDIFGLLGSGGALVIPSVLKRLEPSHWISLLGEHKVTTWNTVPSLMQMLVDYLERRERLSDLSLKNVLLSGDWIPINLPGRVSNLFPEARIFSLGGATEASIWSNYHEVKEVKPEWKSIPYGRPLTNQSFFVLNNYGRDCPDYVPGQLHIGGLGLAKGYLNDPQKTAKSFVRHPQTGEDLYATGDLGCYMADGEIEFLGRRDQQVKINGYRIELGEIESQLLEHSAVNQALVLAAGEEKSNRVLAAFVSLKEGYEHQSKDDLLLWLNSTLPSYMAPQIIVILPKLPLSATGKVDREALKNSLNDFKSQKVIVGAETQMEKTIAQVLSSVLGRDDLSVESRFFEMGLSSLDLVAVQSQLESQIGQSIPLIKLLEHATIRSLGSYLAQNSQSAPSLERGANRALRRQNRRVKPIDQNQGEEREISLSTER